MKLLVLGGTGQVGRHLVERALAGGHEVTALVRDPASLPTSNPALTIEKGQATELADLERVIAGKDAVVSAVGPRTKKDKVRSASARALVEAAKKHGVRRLVVLSASGVGSSKEQIQRASFVFGRIIMPIFLKEIYADQAIGDELIEKSGLDWVVVRPLALTNKAPIGNVHVIVDANAKIPSLKISRADVAQFLLEQVASDRYLGQMPLICG